MNKIYDIMIVGAGPAGMTAAIYAARANKNVAIIDKDGFGGNIAKSPKVENIPGFVSISGSDFAENMYNQLIQFQNIEIIYDEVIEETLDTNNIIKISLAESEDVLYGKTLIIATGTQHRTLDLPTKNIYYCVTCDGPFFKNKDVIVVGSGNSGATYALELATYCNQVYLCDITKTMCCEKTLQDRIIKSNIKWLPECIINEVILDENNNLKQLEVDYAYDNISRNILKLPVNAIFAAIGMFPCTAVIKDINLDNKGYIIADESCKTNIKNIFVAGDVRTKNIRQVTTAVADGTTAAIQAMNYLEQN